MQPSACTPQRQKQLVWADVSFEMKENSLNFHVNKSWHLIANMLDNM